MTLVACAQPSPATKPKAAPAPTTAPASASTPSPAPPTKPPNPEVSLTPEGGAAWDILVAAEVFATGLVGYAAQVPGEIPAWQALTREPEAAAAFRALAGGGGAATRAYGLCGVWHLDRASFDELAERAIRETPTVRLMSGCIVLDVGMADLIGTSKKSDPSVDSIRDGVPTEQLLTFGVARWTGDRELAP